MRDYCGGYARTTVDQNLVLRWVRDESVYDVWPRLCASSASATPGADEVTDVVSCPGTDSLQARHHELDGPQRGRPGARRGDGDRRPAHQADPHQDERLPQRLRPAPHRRTSASTARRSRSASTRSRPTSPTSAARYEGGEVGYGQRLKVRLPAKRVPEAVERWLRMLRGRARRRRDASTPSSTASGRREFEDAGPASSRCPSSSASSRWRLHRLEPQRALPGHPRRGRVRGLAEDADLEAAREDVALRGRALPPAARTWPAPSRRRSR